MAQQNAIFGSQPSGRPHFGRATGIERSGALSLLLTGVAEPIDEQAVDRFEQHIRDQEIDGDQLWLAQIGDQALSSVLIVPNPGRTGMVFQSPMIDRMLVSVASQLVRTACGEQDPARMALLQALLDPGQQLERQTLLEGGFMELAQLIYMQRAISGSESRSAIDPQLKVATYEKRHHALFGRAIEASYRQTLDCPGLVGMRRIDDIITGHMAAGSFTPEHWFVLIDGDQPAGVMLLNDVPHQRAMELVYLGLSPAWRGRGVAGQLVQDAMGLAVKRGAEQILLAVDERNTPAMTLYKAMGFKPTARKLAMIFALSKCV